jgi:hypothetical protein
MRRNFETSLDRSTKLSIAAGSQARPATYQLGARAFLIAGAGWGWLPTLALWSACGLVLVAMAYNIARAGADGANLLFWGGLLMVFVPVAARLAVERVARHERIGLVVLLGLALYMVKLLHSPLAFTFSDELQHWRTAGDIAQSGYLFHENPLLPVSPLFPGLENVAVALAGLTGLSFYGAGAVVLAAARLVAMLALYLFFEHVGRSARLAGMAALLYAAHPSYLFFDAQFAYESLALPLAVLVLYFAARRAQLASFLVPVYRNAESREEREENNTAAASASGAGERIGFTLALVLALAAVIMTHHVTAYALAAFLSLWALLASIRPDDRDAPMHPRGLALLTLVMALTWLVYAASLTASYLFPQLSGSVLQLLRLIAGDAVGRELFRSPAGLASPLWEQLAGYAAIVLILLGLPFGLRRLWHTRRGDPLAMALAVGALAYPASLGLRLAQRGAEASNRGAAFLFVAVAFVLAAWVSKRPLLSRLKRGWLPAFVAWAAIIFTGGIAVGWPPPWARMPGPYLVAADTRSINPQSLAAADWMRSALGEGNRLATDRTNRLLLGAYGRQRPVTSFADKARTSQLFFAQSIGKVEREIIQRGQVRYLVVDRRLSGGLPSSGAYFERGEVAADWHARPIDPAALAKFDGLENVGRIFDSGDILIYDIGAAREP